MKFSLNAVKIFFAKVGLAVLSFFRGSFWSEKQHKVSLLYSVLVNIIMWAAVLIKIGVENKPMPLHFNAFYGIEFVGSGFLLLLLPLIGLVILIVNTALARYVARFDDFLPHLVNYGSALIQTLLAIAASSIIYLNR